MAKKSTVRQAPTYKEYHTFLKSTNKPKILKNVTYYLKQYSFFKDLANAMPCAIYLLDYSTQKYLFVSESCESITGYSSKEAMEMGQMEYTKRLVYKDDAKIFTDKVFISFIEAARKLPDDGIRKCRFSVNYRLIRKDGIVIKVLQQTAILETNNQGYPQLVLGIITDISAHKSDNKMVLSISHYDKTTGFKTISSDSFSPEDNKLTLREKEIVKHIVYGHNTNKIADILFISPLTVKVHRRHILEKTNCKNVAELINYSINNGIA